MADGPSNYWPLNDATGPVKNLAAPTRTGTVNGTVTLGATGLVPGDPSVSFGGGFIEVSDDNSLSPLNTGPASFEAWVMPTTLDGVQAHTYWIATKGNASSQYEWALSITGDGRLYFVSWTLAGNNITSGQTAAGAIATGNAYHVAGAISNSAAAGSGALALYINGQAAPIANTPGPTSAGPPGNGSSTVRFGGRSDGVANNWTGRIGHIAIYPEALTSGQVAEHYTVGTRSGVSY